MVGGGEGGRRPSEPEQSKAVGELRFIKWSFREMYTFKEEDIKLQLMAGTAQRLCRCL